MKVYFANILSILGHIDQARAQREESTTEARRIGQEFTLMLGRLVSAIFNWIIRSPEHLRQDADEVITIGSEHGYPQLQALANLFRGWNLSELGQPKEGLAQIAKFTPWALDIGHFLWASICLFINAHAAAKLGQADAALGHLSEAAAAIEKTNVRWME